MPTRTDTPTHTTTTSNGSEAILGTPRLESDVTEKFSQSLGSAMETFSTFGTVSQQVGSVLLEQSTSAAREGFDVTAKISGAVLDATKDTFTSFSATFDPLTGWSRLVDTSTQAYTEYATRLAASAEDATEKVRDAVRVLADEVSANGIRLSR